MTSFIEQTKVIILLCVTIFSLALVILSGVTSASETDVLDKKRVEVAVYYESFCPDSKRFFLKQLLPTYRDVGSIMNLTLVPFGHARILGSDKMVCQHGRGECDYNRLMACIQDRAGSNNLATIETLSCIFEKRDKVKECLVKYLPNLDYTDINKCRTGNESFKMMETFESLTGRPSYIPKLMLNSLYSEDIQNELEHNLKYSVCKNYSESKPEKCNDADKVQMK